jgi:hypothetical protein
MLPHRQQHQADDATATAATQLQFGVEKPACRRSDAGYSFCCNWRCSSRLL